MESQCAMNCITIQLFWCSVDICDRHRRHTVQCMCILVWACTYCSWWWVTIQLYIGSNQKIYHLSATLFTIHSGRELSLGMLWTRPIPLLTLVMSSSGFRFRTWTVKQTNKWQSNFQKQLNVLPTVTSKLPLMCKNPHSSEETTVPHCMAHLTVVESLVTISEQFQQWHNKLPAKVFFQI